jgi:trehalose 6-phosphate synthase/phosphatase
MLVEHIGFGTKLRAVALNQDFRKLDSSEVLRSFNSAKNRVLFFDNEGTLAADVRHICREYGAPQGDVSDLKSHGTSPSEQVLKHLRTLCADSRNTVVILSGRDQTMLEQWFGSVPRIGLAAEHGFYWKLPNISGDQWNCAKEDNDISWKTYAFELMRTFVKRTQGSFIENKGSALVWQYRDADQHFGSWQAKELTLHLKELLFGWELEVINGKGYVEVKTRGVNKGVAVNTVLEKVTQECGTVDFVLCIGDDRSDEDMFDALNQFIDPGDVQAEMKADNSSLSTTESEHSDRENDGLQFQSKFGRQAFSTNNLSGLGSVGGNLSTCHELSVKPARRRFFACTIGRKPSAAKFFLDDVDEVSDLLSQLQWKRRFSKDISTGLPLAHHTWSGGDGQRHRRVDSMPALASLVPPAFGTDPGLLPGAFR